ncbi:MAG: hypothetical protein J6S92_13700 [Oscillospiraceae bacterium]|nr:hypothetical protein [Oscillospiraceae bacterium]MBP0989312.1 hypothetical protein [Oscillospiraceae bacterium]MBQ5339842.1 hypothetical protein [Oscillospiraceae bacterium]
MMPQYGYPYYSPVNSIYQQPPMPQMQAPQQASAQPQIRSGGIVSVANEDEARRYPVAPGYTVTMRDENSPYIYEKTMGFSQLEQPIFRKARIVFEDDAPKQEKAADPPQPVYAEMSQLEALRSAVAADIRELQSYIMNETSDIRSIISALDPKKTARKKEAEE